MRRNSIAIWATMAALAWPATVLAAPSTLTYPGDTVTVSGNPTAFSLTVSQFTRFVFPAGFQTTYAVASTEGFADASGGRCNDDSGATPPTSFTCSPLPAMTSVTGSPQGDTVTAGCNFIFGSARMTVSAGDGADTITAACGSDLLRGGAGNDSIEAGAGNDEVDGEDGEDSVAGGSGGDVMSGGTGDDSLQAGSGDDTADGGSGADAVSGGEGTDHLRGQDGRDALAGGVGDDLLEGGADRDTLDGGEGNDTLDGGDGRDLLLPGPGSDIVRGGPSLDAVSYEDRGGQPLRISLNGTADDGEPGENDAIESDVENVIGSPGPDSIVGNDGPNDLDAGASNDTIEPAGGADFVDAGAGDDRITARDGVQDRIECGSGVDVAIVDEFDIVAGCENVESSRELMADVDNDGIPAPADCDDRNAGIRPGIPDKPGNRVDDDCLGGDAAFARIETPIQFRFKLRRRYTRITRLLVLDVPSASTIEVRCRGGRRRGCFKGVKRSRVARATAQKNLSRVVRKRKLRRGARIEVRVLRAASVGKVLRLTMRARKVPRLSRRCLPPGTRTPRRC